MGSVAAMNSIDRVLDKHSDELRQQYEEHVPAQLRDIFERVGLENICYGIRVHWIFKGDATLEGPEISIDTLADWYSDCEIGY